MATYATPTAKAFRGHTLLRAVQFETIISHSVVLHPKMLHSSTVGKSAHKVMLDRFESFKKRSEHKSKFNH